MTSIRLLILCNDEKASAKHATSYYEQIFMSARRARRFLLKLIARCSNPRLCKAILALANEWLLAELEPHLVFLAICLLVPVPKRTFQVFKARTSFSMPRFCFLIEADLNSVVPAFS